MSLQQSIDGISKGTKMAIKTIIKRLQETIEVRQSWINEYQLEISDMESTIRELENSLGEEK